MKERIPMKFLTTFGGRKGGTKGGANPKPPTGRNPRVRNEKRAMANTLAALKDGTKSPALANIRREITRRNNLG